MLGAELMFTFRDVVNVSGFLLTGKLSTETTKCSCVKGFVVVIGERIKCCSSFWKHWNLLL